MPTVAKMQLNCVEDYGMSRKYKFSCVYDNNLATPPNEDKRFTKATPSGEAWMTVDNSAVWPQFQLPHINESGGYESGSKHYVLFIDAGKNSLKDVLAAAAQLR